MKPLARKQLPRDAALLARYLIGKTLVRDTRAGRMAGRIVEQMEKLEVKHLLWPE